LKSALGTNDNEDRQSQHKRGNDTALQSVLFFPQKPLQRLLFSATLTDNPRKLAMLGIRNPMIIRATSADFGAVVAPASLVGGDVEEGEGDEEEVERTTTMQQTQGSSGFVVPPSLSEFFNICDTERRPHILLALLIDALGSSTSKRTGKVSAPSRKKGDVLSAV
jgi:superfamily II DNA/RNA helicase